MGPGTVGIDERDALGDQSPGARTDCGGDEIASALVSEARIAHQGGRHQARFQCVGQVRELVDHDLRPNLVQVMLQRRRFEHVNHDRFYAQLPELGNLALGAGGTEDEPPVGNEIIGTVKSGVHLGHHNEVQTPGQVSKAKEPNIENVHIFIAFTEANVTIAPAINTFVFDGIVKRGVYDREFEPAQEGKRAWYFVRLMSKGKAAKYGPPSALWNSVIM